MPTMQERLEALRAKRAEGTATTEVTAKPAALSMKERLAALRAQRQVTAGPSVSGSAGVDMPTAPTSIGAPLPKAPVAANRPDRWQNIAVHGVNEAVAGTAALGGVIADTALNIPRMGAAALLPKSAYEKLYGAPAEVPFMEGTEAGSEFAGNLRATVAGEYPMPSANQDFQAEMQAGDGGFVDAVVAGVNHPVGAFQEIIKQGITTGLGGRAVGILPAIAITEGGGADQAGAAFDAEWDKGIPQQSAAYQELLASVGPEQAKRILRAQRQQVSSLAQAAAGVALGKVSDKLGGMELEKTLAGQGSKLFTPAEVVKQAILEMPEEGGVQIAGNIASQWTGDPNKSATEGVGGAMGAGLVMGGGQSSAIAAAQYGARALANAPSNVKTGVAAARKLLDSKQRDVPKTNTIKFDPKINEALAANATADTGIAAKQEAAKPPQYSSFVASILEDPNVKAVYDSLQDPAARQKMLDDLSLADTLKKEGNERKQLSMKKAAADREWVKTNAITSHPSFAEADAAVRGGATTVDKLRKAVPNLSRITAPLVIKHLEEAGVVSAPDNKKQRTVLQPTPVAAGTTQNNIALPVQPAIQPSVQSDNIATTQNNNVEQKSVLTLPEDVPSIAQEPAAVNTPAPAQTETVQKSPRVEPKGPIRLRPPTTAPVEVAAVETPVSPAVGGVATTLPAPTQNAAVAPPVQPQTPSEVAPTGLTPQTKARRQKVVKAAAPQAAPAVEPTAIGKSKVAAPATKVLDAKLVAETAAKDAEEIPFIRGVHEDYMKARGKSAEGTYVQQVLDGQTPTAQPTADDAAFVKTLGWSLPETAAQPTETATAPVTTTPTAKPPRAKATPKPTPQEASVAKAQAEVAADKQEKERIAAKIPSDAELVGAGLSPAEVTLLKKNPEQHREVLDAVNRGEIRVSSKEAATPTGMRPVTEEDITKAKTRPEKDKLQRLKAKYEQATDAPRKLSGDSVRNVAKEAIARAYERIKSLAQAPNMSQFDAIPNDPESTKAILGLQAEAQKTVTTEAELAQKLEDTYVNNYKRNHPDVDRAPKGWDSTGTTQEGDNAKAADNHIRANVRNGKQALEAVVSGAIAASAPIREMARRLLASSDMTDVTVTLEDDAKAAGLVRKDGTTIAGNYTTDDNAVKLLSMSGGRVEDIAEVIVHELAHAGTIRAMIKLESGELVNQELSDLLEDIKLGLLELRKRFDAGEVRDPEARVAYAATSVMELVATVYGSPRAARRLDDASVTIPRRGARRGRVTTVLQDIKDFVARLFGITPQQAERVLLSARIREAVERMSSNTAVRTEFTGTDAAFAANARLRANTRGVDSGTNAAPPTTPPLTDTTGIGPEATIQRIKDVFFGMIRNRGIASPDAQAMIEERSGLESAMMLEAEFAVDHVRQALVDALHGVSKATREIYNNNLLKYLNGDRSAVLPAPLVQRLTELRKLIDDRSLALIALGVIPKDEIATVLQNFGKWTHRDFQAFQMAPGIQNKKGVWAKHVEQMKADGKRDLVAENIEALKNDMRLPSKAEIARMGKDARDKNSPTGKATEAQLLIWSLRWGLNTEKMSGKNSILSKLKELSDMGEAKLVEKANEYAKAMLDPLYLNAPVDPHGEFNPKAGVYADDSSVSQDRTPLPQWLKNLWGEYTKWDTVAMITLENQSKMIAKYIALTRYKARLLASKQLFEATDTRSKRGYALLDSKVYGPLNGYYIPEKDLWLIQSGNTLAAIDAAYGARARGEDSLLTKAIEMYKGIVKFLGPIGAALKVVQVLYSHLTAFVNLATTSISMSGVIPRFGALKHLGNSAKVARASAFGGVGILTAKKSAFGGKLMVGRALEPGTELNRQLMFLASKNMLHDSVLAADTRRKYKQQLQAEVRANLKMGHGAMLVVKDAIPWSIDRASRVNSFGDEIAKHLSWASRVDALTTIFPSMSEAEVWGLAAKEVMATMPSYIHAWPIARAVSSTGIFGPYMTFNTEVLRNAGNSLLLAKHYAAMDSSAARVYAAQELASVAVRLMGAGLLNTFVLGSMAFIAQSVLGTGGDDDEEKKLIEAQREAAVKYNSGQGYSDFRNALPGVHGHVTVLRDLGNGKYTFYSAQRYDISVFGSLMEAAVYGDGEEYGSIFTDTFASLTASVPALTKMAAGWASSKKASEGTVAYDDAINTMEAGKKELKEAFTPGTIKTLLRTSDAAEKGVELTPDERLFNHTGFTVQIFDSHTTLSMAAADYNGLRLRTTRSVKEQMREEAPELDFQAATLAKLSLWERTRKKVENFKGLGMDYDTIYAAVKDNPISDSIPEDELVGLYENVFQMPNYIETVEDIRDQALVKAGEDTAEVERIISLYDKYIEQAEQSDIQMRAILESQGVTVR